MTSGAPWCSMSCNNTCHINKQRHKGVLTCPTPRQPRSDSTDGHFANPSLVDPNFMDHYTQGRTQLHISCPQTASLEFRMIDENFSSNHSSLSPSLSLSFPFSRQALEDQWQQLCCPVLYLTYLRQKKYSRLGLKTIPQSVRSF